MPVLSTEQLTRLAAWSEAAANTPVAPDHLGTGYSLGSTEGQPEAIQALQNYAYHLSQVAASNYNHAVYSGGGQAGQAGVLQPRVLSGAGFSEGTIVTYAPASVYSKVPWVKDTDREIKQLVLHSFGHSWHANKVNDTWKGTMNTFGGVIPVVAYLDRQNTLVFVSKGTDVTAGMSNPARFSSCFQSAIYSTENTVGAHFFIDRTGNLYITADCNDVFNSALDLSETCLTIELEEALYSLSEPTKNNPATWLPGTGSSGVRGTEGTLQYFDFSAMQLLTLATLVKKLQRAYPELQTRNHASSIGGIRSGDSGYTLHANISGTQSVDPLPHFSTEDQWTAFFDLVDSISLEDNTSIFEAPLSGTASRAWWVKNISSITGPSDSPLSQLYYNELVYSALALVRATNIVNKSRGDYNLRAGNQAAELSKNIREQLANFTFMQSITGPIDTKEE